MTLSECVCVVIQGCNDLFMPVIMSWSLPSLSDSDVISLITETHKKKPLYYHTPPVYQLINSIIIHEMIISMSAPSYMWHHHHNYHNASCTFFSPLPVTIYTVL